MGNNRRVNPALQKYGSNLSVNPRSSTAKTKTMSNNSAMAQKRDFKV